MEIQVARQRMDTIAGHFAIADGISAAATAIVPVNCNGGLKSVLRRYDNGMYFARQGSCSQACFMRQASMDQATGPVKTGVSAGEGSATVSEAPLFSRPAKMEPRCKSGAAPEPPMFARPNIGGGGQWQFHRAEKSLTESNGFERSSRMDVAESGSSYILTLELPGVRNSDIRVEVDNKMLGVRDRRLTWSWRVVTLSNDVLPMRDKREISQGPYYAEWTLPANANKDRVSAELADGVLQIIIPKL